MVTVSDTINLPDGSPAAGLELTFSRLSPSATLAGVTLAGEVIATTDTSGVFSVELEIGHYKVDLPVKGELLFSITETMLNPVKLAQLNYFEPLKEDLPEDEEWKRLKGAAVTYSRFRPLQKRFILPGGQRDYQIGNCVRVLYCDCGTGAAVEPWTPTEILTVEENTESTGWAFYGGKLHLAAATDSTEDVTVVAEMYHEADEIQRGFPTIPFQDLWIVEDLAEASRLLGESADSILSTTIGGTTFRWRDGNASTAERLRQDAINALRENITVWG